MRRRALLNGTVLGALASAATAQTAGAAQGTTTDARALERLSALVEGLRNDLRDEWRFTEIAPIRNAQKTYLRTNGTVPDFIDVGVDVWFDLHDWHVRWQQALEHGRDAQGRSTLAMNGTRMVLRTDVQPGYVSLPYDAR